MANRSPQIIARDTASALMLEARSCGWERVKAEIKPDGTTVIDAAMTGTETDDDFNSDNLRMGK